ncbi:MAG: sigma-70 family RNA polymerase sigma factor, partial [Candidatus Krumholzibacteria bacterium]|nr:sigma-70 family RNA polymerase sigma factor [Candidatus Krumholzibacteria bacterium]
KAFGKIVEKHTGVVYAAVRSVLGSRGDIDDAVQEAFIRIYRGLPSFTGRSSLSTWIWSVARNNTINIRAKERDDVIPLDKTAEIASNRLGPEAEFARRSAAEDIEYLLSRLEGDYRQVIELRYLAGKKYHEIAEMLDMPEGTVKTLIHRARIKMKRMMDERDKAGRRENEAVTGM